MLMNREQRRYVIENVRAQIWDHWSRGLSISEITRVLPTRRVSVGSIIRGHGGIRPPPRCRSSRALSSVERELICKGLAAGCSMREIARHLKRAPSTVSREVRQAWWPDGLQRAASRRTRLEAGTSTENLPIGSAPSIASTRHPEALDRLVAASDQRMAEKRSIRMMRPCASHTRRSIAAGSFRRVAC